MEQNNIIYGLKDPRTDDIMYVGKSIQGLLRPKQHLVGSHNELVRDWVNALHADNLEPEIIVLERSDSPDFLIDKEKFWMDKLLKEKHPLLNTIIYETHIEKRRNIAKIEKELQKEKEILDQKLEAMQKEASDTLVSHYNELSKMIKKRRKLAGITQKQLADISGVGKTCIFDIEHGKETLQVNTLNKILTTLGIKTTYFIPNV